MSVTAESAPVETGKSELRRRAILDVARDLFLAQGFAATSMSEIATRLGGSKGTLYNYFRSKEELFAALMIDTCQGPANALFDHMPPLGQELRSSLIELGSGLLRFIVNGPQVPVYRVVVAEAGRFPSLGRFFYEAGPLKGQEKLEGYFQALIGAGEMPPAKPELLARRFKDLVLSDLHSRRMWGVLDELTEDQIIAYATEATDVFLAAFRPEPR